MEGPTPSATVVNQTMVMPPALTELIPDIPSRIIRRHSAGAGQGPGRTIRELCVAGPGNHGGASPRKPTSVRDHRGPRPRRAVILGRYLVRPARSPMPVGASTREGASAARSVKPHRWSACSRPTRFNSSWIPPRTGPPVSPSAVVVDGLDDEPESDPSAATVVAERPEIARAVGSLRGRRAGRSRPRESLLCSRSVRWRCSWRRRARAVEPVSPRYPREGRTQRDAGGGRDDDANRRRAPDRSRPRRDQCRLSAPRNSNGWKRRPPNSKRHPPAEGSRSICIGMGSMEGARAVLDGPGADPDPGLVAGQQCVSRRVRAGVAHQTRQPADPQESRTWR